jgi:FkbM family methyltransferase
MIPSAKSWPGRLLRLPLRWVAPRVPRRIVGGPLAGMQWVPGSAPHGCWLGTYERDLQRIMVQTVRPGATFFDIGANAGFFTLLASKLVGVSGRVVAVEPLGRNLEFLRQHLAINSITNVDVVEAAVAEAPGHAHIESGPAPSMAHLGPHGQPVRVTTIDELAASTGHPGVIKMDIEGAESRALSGARETLRVHRPIVLLSTHGHEQDGACRSYLEQLGYSVTARRDGAADGQYEVVARPRAQ